MIYVPVSMVEAAKKVSNGDYQLCTKVIFCGYEISIAVDQSLTAGRDLSRCELRIYDAFTGEDALTHISKECKRIFNEDLVEPRESTDLFQIMKTIHAIYKNH